MMSKDNKELTYCQTEACLGEQCSDSSHESEAEFG